MASVVSMRKRAAQFVPSSIRNFARPLARRLRIAPAPGAWDRIAPRMERFPFGPDVDTSHVCNICQWAGGEFVGPFHCEMASCPRCGSIARDRFLLFSFLSRTAYRKNLRVLETSPRLGDAYRRCMRRSFSYTTSDFDLSAHEGDIQLDLQAIDLPDASIDVLLTPHVLEHVPDTSRALREIFRILTPGGRMYLQVPLCRGTTAVPSEPEFHADNTPVFFNFGWDLTKRIREAGFEVCVLVTQDYFDILSNRSQTPISTGDGFHLESLWSDVVLDDLSVVADSRTSQRLGFAPAHHFATWECIKPFP